MTNPANAPALSVTEENRIPMGIPQLTLEVPEREGYHRHWFLDRPGRIARALRGGFTFVDSSSVQLNSTTITGTEDGGGNTDLGSRVSVHGGVDEQGKGTRLYLMEIKQEWWEKDVALREETSERIAETLRGGRVGAEKGSQQDAAMRYTRGTENIFTRKTKRR